MVSVVALSVTPIKGFALHHPTSIDMGPNGAVGDRDFYLVDERDAMYSVIKSGAFVGISAHVNDGMLTLTEGDQVIASGPVQPTEPHDASFFGYKQVPGRFVPGPWDAVLSERAGRSVRLVQAFQSGGGHDIEPLTFVGRSSLARLSQQAGAAVDSRRFRMLVEFDGAPAHAEDRWHGRQARIGSAVVEFGGLVPRCAATTRHPESGEIDLQTLKLIGDYRGRQETEFGPSFTFGIYGMVVQPGRISVGDDIALA